MDSAWFEVSGWIFDAVSSLGAVAALVIAVMAYRVAKRQGKQSFEVEVLRELATLLEKDPEIGNRGPGESPIAVAARVRLSLLPLREMSLWWGVVDEPRSFAAPRPDEPIDMEAVHRMREKVIDSWLKEYRSRETRLYRMLTQHEPKADQIVRYLNKEILNAIERRSR